MTKFSRVIFAGFGMFLGLAVGSVFGFGACYRGLFDPPDVQSDAVILIAIVGGAICGLAIGIMIPRIIEANKARNEAELLPQTIGKDVWPPPPSI